MAASFFSALSLRRLSCCRFGFPSFRVSRSPRSGSYDAGTWTGSPVTHTLCESGCGTISDASKSPHVSAT